jgi:hypothetical protein
MNSIATGMAALLFALSSVAAAATFLGAGAGSGQLSNPTQMNAICRETYSDEEEQHGNVRWASTRDFREASNRQGWGGDPHHRAQVEKVALRAEDTIFTPDGRAYDQATGALSPPKKPRYPGAVILTTDGASFSSKKAQVVPMCVYGSPSEAPP